jgi:hypothetical protein
MVSAAVQNSKLGNKRFFITHKHPTAGRYISRASDSIAQSVTDKWHDHFLPYHPQSINYQILPSGLYNLYS